MPIIPHDDVIKWKHFRGYWPFVWGIHWSLVNSPPQRPVTRNFDVFFDLRLNKKLSKQLWGQWSETPSRSLWCHCNVDLMPANMPHTINCYHSQAGLLVEPLHIGCINCQVSITNFYLWYEHFFIMTFALFFHQYHIDGLVLNCSISIANAMEILQSCTSHRYQLDQFHDTRRKFPMCLADILSQQVQVMGIWRTVWLQLVQ